MALEKDITRREFLKWFSLGVASISLPSCDVAVDKISREASKLASADDDEYFYIADIKTESLVNPNSLSAGNAFISTPQGRIKITGQGERTIKGSERLSYCSSGICDYCPRWAL